MHQFENEQDEINRENIVGLIKNHFALTKENFKLFKDKVFNPDIDEIYSNNLSNDLRFKKPINVPINVYGYIDKGWALFKNNFDDFINKFNVSYENFFYNKIEIDKNHYKLIRFLKKFYLNNKKEMNIFLNKNAFNNIEFYLKEDLERIIDGFINNINDNKLPLDKLEIVLSLNFADFFMCSTKETWTSCLNLESEWTGCYWSDLPSFAFDKNRALLYITNGTKKNYNGIVVDRMLSRTFLMLNNNNEINHLKWYPNQIINNYIINNLMKFNIKPIDANYISKHSIKMIEHKNSKSFAFLDFGYIENNVIYYNDKGNHCIENNGKKLTGLLFNYSRGLNGLIEENKKIDDYLITFKHCSICNEVTEDPLRFNGYEYCESCFYDNFFYCRLCSNIFELNESILFDNIFICSDCYSKFIVKCSICKKEILKNGYADTVDENGEYCCKKCKENL